MVQRNLISSKVEFEKKYKSNCGEMTIKES